MGLPRLILFAIIIGGGVWLWRRLQRRSTTAAKQGSATQTMVRCAHCQVHLPEKRAIKKNQNWFCSPEHLEQGPQARH
ncbi:PP0621 family protein [Denitrificimonas sp. JX-1]|uniref:PP0621 family protein n=1 Tax=Denitrificimonas halotolerans TaxID=3098930 RepID=A0ABU5GPN6_9GAMM|nr:PP0621 family protein [Denitrificimonas sp. JX-1]MDY7218719.1 PP0621 family protein [Denitrificimonas sp. JX-1]